LHPRRACRPHFTLRPLCTRRSDLALGALRAGRSRRPLRTGRPLRTRRAGGPGRAKRDLESGVLHRGVAVGDLQLIAAGRDAGNVCPQHGPAGIHDDASEFGTPEEHPGVLVEVHALDVQRRLRGVGRRGVDGHLRRRVIPLRVSPWRGGRHCGKAHDRRSECEPFDELSSVGGKARRDYPLTGADPRC